MKLVIAVLALLGAQAASPAQAVVISHLRAPQSAIVPNLSTHRFGGVGVIDQSCTGTPIGPRHVLTAAHCTGNAKIYKFEIPFDDRKTFSSQGRISIDPRYNVALNSFDQPDVPDLALLRLHKKLPSYVPIYAIAPIGKRPTKTQYIVGYGFTGTGLTGEIADYSDPYTKRFGTNKVRLNPKDSGLYVGDFDRANGANIPLTESALGSGDSGGPLFNAGKQLEITGVASYLSYYNLEGEYGSDSYWVQSDLIHKFLGGLPPSVTGGLPGIAPVDAPPGLLLMLSALMVMGIARHMGRRRILRNS